MIEGGLRFGDEARVHSLAQLGVQISVAWFDSLVEMTIKDMY